MSSVSQHDPSVDRQAGKSHIVTIVRCWCYFRLIKLRNLRSYSAGRVASRRVAIFINALRRRRRRYVRRAFGTPRM